MHCNRAVAMLSSINIAYLSRKSASSCVQVARAAPGLPAKLTRSSQAKTPRWRGILYRCGNKLCASLIT